MKTDTKYLLLGGLALAGFGFYFWNSKRIDQLTAQLNSFNSYPPPRNSPQWEQWIDIALRIYKDVESLFEPGGPFYKKQGGPTQDEVLDIYNANGGYSYYS
ncbi:MAG: hypothetical protein M3Q56_11420 [Bacteroidota bacterium]|nr:hypothetical protein [Bacteroidota bacterium]